MITSLAAITDSQYRITSILRFYTQIRIEIWGYEIIYAFILLSNEKKCMRKILDYLWFYKLDLFQCEKTDILVDQNGLHKSCRKSFQHLSVLCQCSVFCQSNSFWFLNLQEVLNEYIYFVRFLSVICLHSHFQRFKFSFLSLDTKS